MCLTCIKHYFVLFLPFLIWHSIVIAKVFHNEFRGVEIIIYKKMKNLTNYFSVNRNAIYANASLIIKFN